LTEMLDRTVHKLVARRFVVHLPGKSKKAIPAVKLTTEGKAATLDFLKVDQLPTKPKPSWASLKKSLLLAPALGLSSPGGPLAKDDSLRAVLLMKEYNLPLGEYPSLKQARTEWLRKTLGMGAKEKVTLETVQAAMFRRESGDEAPLPPKRALDRLLARRLKAGRDDAKELRDAVLRIWLDHDLGRQSQASVTSESAPAAVDLREFSRKVLAAARACPTGRYGENKIFIVHVWRSLQGDPDLQGTDLAVFKQRLAEANNARLLDLSRADLVQAMDPEDVRLSEVSYLNATFHFIRIESRE
jgi:hypothetical protein